MKSSTLMMEYLGHWLLSPRKEDDFDECFDERFENKPVQE